MSAADLLPDARAALTSLVAELRPRTFQLRAGSVSSRDFEILAFRGEEEISELYEFDVDVMTDADAETMETSLVGADARLMLVVPDRPPRTVHGIVAHVRFSGRQLTTGKALATVRIVPRFWLLKHAKRTRIFQNAGVVEIVQTVLGESSVPCLFRLERSYAPREYCVQYEETDYEFVRRLLAHEGMFFYFEEPAWRALEDEQDHGHETVVFADAAAYPTIDGGYGTDDGRHALIFR